MTRFGRGASLMWSTETMGPNFTPIDRSAINKESLFDTIHISTSSFTDFIPGGLQATFYDYVDLSVPKATKQVQNIDFSSSETASYVHSGIAASVLSNADTFSVRWTGFIRPKYLQETDFQARIKEADERVRWNTRRPPRELSLPGLEHIVTVEQVAELRGGGLEAQAKADYLDRMYTVHGTDFEGDGPYHTDKSFFQTLLSSAPSIVRKQTSTDEEKIIMLSPISIVEAICEKREKIAEEWCKELVNIKEDHTDIQRELLQELY